MDFKFSSRFKHRFHCCLIVIWSLFFMLWTGALRLSDVDDGPDPWIEYGSMLTVVLIAIRLVSFLALPQTLFTLIGLVKYNAFPGKVVLKNSPLLAPFLCVRVVTRGLYPKLVRKTVAQNVETLRSSGLENFVVEVVTDNTSIGIKNDHRVREIVVPSSYRTKSGALNKARALQFCLEEDVNVLGDEDWIVHLDEETLLTQDSVRGILNFVYDGKHQFGQGLITYAKTPASFKSVVKHLQNRICTVADSFRVCDDMGKLRFQLKYFHKPLFGWKGSYVVAKVEAERKISFDNGPEGSKAEDCFFGIMAMDRGYSFDFIEGEMHEKSPFTFSDFFRQRKRWMQGIYLVVSSSRIPIRSKFILGMSLMSWLTMPFTASNIVLSATFPMRLSAYTDFILGFMGAMGIYMYFYGFIKQFPVRRYSFSRLLLSIPEILIASVVSIVAENLAVLSMWGGNWYDFYIVEKEESEYDDDVLTLV